MFYGSVVEFRAYHTARGRDVSDWTDGDIESDLLVGSEWLDAKYRSSFPGLKEYGRDQIREWPRDGAVDIYSQIIALDTVPIEVERATYEAAYKQHVTPGSLSVDWTPNKYKSASVSGAVAVQYMQFDNASDIQTRFKLIDEILSPLTSGVGSSSLSGVSTRI